MLAAYVSRGSDLTTWLEGAQINRESSLRLQYLAGLAIEVDRDQEIYRSIARYRQYPNDIFVAPSWKWIEHETEAEAVLFSYSDRVAQQKLGFWREQRGRD